MEIKIHEGIKKSLMNFLMVLISFSFIIFYLYWRITKKQPEIMLIQEEIQKHFGVFLYFFLISLFILILLLVSVYMKKKLNASDKKKELGRFSKFLFKVDKIITHLNIFYKAYTVVFHLISPMYMQYVIAYAGNIVNFSKFKSKVIIIICVVLPRLLISLIFIFEIYKHSLHFYFYSLLLLLIPLFFRFILFVYNDISTQVLPRLNEVVERVPNTENITLTINGKTETFGTLGFRFRPECAYRNGRLLDIDHFMMTFYNPMLFIDGHMEIKLMPLYSKYVTRTLLIYMGIQVVGWGYILFFL